MNQDLELRYLLSDLAMSRAQKILGNTSDHRFQFLTAAVAPAVGDIYVLRLGQAELALRVTQRHWDLMRQPQTLTLYLALPSEPPHQALPG